MKSLQTEDKWSVCTLERKNNKKALFRNYSKERLIFIRNLNFLLYFQGF
jgi:hypothetical protein